MENKDTTLQDTLSGTTSGVKMRNTADAQLRRKVVELNKRYKNQEFTRKILYMVDGYSPDEIQAEMDGYNNIVSGQPIPGDEDEERIENRQRQMMYNDILTQINTVDPDDPESGPVFDPNSEVDRAQLINDMALGYEGISLDEIVGAVNERLPQQGGGEQAPVEEENIGSDFNFGEMAGYNVLGGQDTSMIGKIADTASGLWGKMTGIGAEEAPPREDIFQPPRQQVQGARFDNFRQGVEEKLSGTQTIENTLGEPPSVEGVTAMQPGGPPPAEERYPTGVVEGWDKPNEVSGLPIEEGKKTYEQSRMELKDIDILSKDYKPRTQNQVPQSEIDSYKQKIREVFGDEADLAIQVMLEESKGIAEDVGDTDKTFDYKGEKIGDSVGLFQIRTGGKDWPTTKSRAEVEGIPLYQFRNNMLDPDQNIRYAKYLVDKEGWQLWSTYNTAKKKLNK